MACVSCINRIGRVGSDARVVGLVQHGDPYSSGSDHSDCGISTDCTCTCTLDINTVQTLYRLGPAALECRDQRVQPACSQGPAA